MGSGIPHWYVCERRNDWSLYSTLGCQNCARKSAKEVQSIHISTKLVSHRKNFNDLSVLLLRGSEDFLPRCGFHTLHQMCHCWPVLNNAANSLSEHITGNTQWPSVWKGSSPSEPRRCESPYSCLNKRNGIKYKKVKTQLISLIFNLNCHSLCEVRRCVSPQSSCVLSVTRGVECGSWQTHAPMQK